MSRQWERVTDDITIYFGTDHALGLWLDITDKRYAVSEQDEQGEGYVYEYSQKFGVSTNLVELTMEEIDFHNRATVIEKCNLFINKLHQEN